MQLNQAVLDRENISDSAASAVRTMIVYGELPAGERINEVHLSLRLGVSRTPLREALARLANEGALRSVPRIGYFVRPLTVEEFEQLYAIRPLLDPEALRLAGIPSNDALARLDAVNKRLGRARDADTALACDDEFHRLLLAGCPNGVLLELIDNFILRTRRYESALMRETKSILRATQDHARILDALRAGSLEGACEALKANMQSARDPMIAWLTSRRS